MDSWSTTLRLMALMAVIAIFYLLGRWLAETLHGLAANGVPPWDEPAILPRQRGMSPTACRRADRGSRRRQTHRHQPRHGDGGRHRIGALPADGDTNHHRRDPRVDGRLPIAPWPPSRLSGRPRSPVIRRRSVPRSAAPAPPVRPGRRHTRPAPLHAPAGWEKRCRLTSSKYMVWGVGVAPTGRPSSR